LALRFRGSGAGIYSSLLARFGEGEDLGRLDLAGGGATICSSGAMAAMETGDGYVNGLSYDVEDEQGGQEYGYIAGQHRYEPARDRS